MPGEDEISIPTIAVHDTASAAKSVTSSSTHPTDSPDDTYSTPDKVYQFDRRGTDGALYSMVTNAEGETLALTASYPESRYRSQGLELPNFTIYVGSAETRETDPGLDVCELAWTFPDLKRSLDGTHILRMRDKGLLFKPTPTVGTAYTLASRVIASQVDFNGLLSRDGKSLSHDTQAMLMGFPVFVYSKAGENAKISREKGLIKSEHSATLVYLPSKVPPMCDTDQDGKQRLSASWEKILPASASASIEFAEQDSKRPGEWKEVKDWRDRGTDGESTHT